VQDAVSPLSIIFAVVPIEMHICDSSQGKVWVILWALQYCTTGDENRTG
jgi:hypothetical protein